MKTAEVDVAIVDQDVDCGEVGVGEVIYVKQP